MGKILFGKMVHPHCYIEEYDISSSNNSKSLHHSELRGNSQDDLRGESLYGSFRAKELPTFSITLDKVKEVTLPGDATNHKKLT